MKYYNTVNFVNFVNFWSFINLLIKLIAFVFRKSNKHLNNNDKIFKYFLIDLQNTEQETPIEHKENLYLMTSKDKQQYITRFYIQCKQSKKRNLNEMKNKKNNSTSNKRRKFN